MPIPQQNILENVPIPRTQPTNVHGTDVKAFIIQVIDPETGKGGEILSLEGTNRPFSPIITPITQEISKTYYPGNTNRKPTVQIMGSIEDNVRLEGVFEARNLIPGNREIPMKIVEILNRLCAEGNMCKFQIGPWIRYGFIEQFTPSFQMKSMYKWNMELNIVGRENPYDKQKQTAVDRSNKFFGEAKLSDLRDIRQKVLDDIEASKIELEDTSYLPIIRSFTDGVFNLPEWLTQLRDIGPIGRVADIGSVIYDFVIDTAEIGNSIIDSIENFTNQVDQISKETTKFILTIENLRSRLFRQATSLYNSYSRISSSLDTAVRLSSLNPISAVGGVYFNLSNLSKDIVDTARRGQEERVIRTHVVKINDTLQLISTRYYGDWRRWEELRNVNNLENSNLTENQILVIPE